ncbi:WhiB family transcriptional regulator [Streptomyces sp. AMCC400023]|uniref:WhiB family transcriptional regulator n=1 Tax=Streptomyces sp. AMCC400023 TaxID=2056258 RepID=UPI001F2962F4|nr:WhiB family transcriptional regulator [Streptomyces sp. AMCC400023]UJV42030.1 hypothetical protein CVT30_21250 [Streptomyces sp. AMCC400023]
MRAAPPTPSRREPDWRDDAACRDVNDDTFFPQPGDTARTNYAKSICGRCPVQPTCLAVALAEEGGRTKDNRFGVRGGLTHGQRYALYTRRRTSAKAAA